jgi:hypothetical protein
LFTSAPLAVAGHFLVRGVLCSAPVFFGPKDDGTYVVEFRTAQGEALAISIPRSETAVIRYFQQRMPYGLFVPDVQP